MRICLLESDIGKCEFEILSVKTYLFKKTKASPFFTRDDEKEAVNIHFNNPISGDLIYGKETD